MRHRHHNYITTVGPRLPKVSLALAPTYLPTALPMQDLCRALSELHDRAPQHTYLHTRLEVLRAFGRPIEELFESFDPRPLASGSIAQVRVLAGNSMGLGGVGRDICLGDRLRCCWGWCASSI